MMKTYTLPRLIINLKNVRSNYRELCKRSNGTTVGAVVKDDSYGCGCADVVEALVQEGCNTFFVDYAPCGVIVRQKAPQADIYCLQSLGLDTLDEIKQAHLIPVLGSLEDLQIFKQANLPNIPLAINIETGLNRLGFRPSDIQTLSSEDRAAVKLCLSHLACSSYTYHPLNGQQLQRFAEMKNIFPNAKFTLGASDTFQLGPRYYFDIIRVGANLYGIDTFETNRDYLKQAMHVQAAVLQIADLPTGESVSYGATYKATSPRKIAIIGIGYGDGLPRSLSNGKGKVFYEGHEIPILGRICMDNIICDITDVPNLQTGVLVDVLNDTYTADDMGIDAGTIGYEIISTFGKNKRFKRIVIR